MVRTAQPSTNGHHANGKAEASAEASGTGTWDPSYGPREESEHLALAAMVVGQRPNVLTERHFSSEARRFAHRLLCDFYAEEGQSPGATLWPILVKETMAGAHRLLRPAIEETSCAVLKQIDNPVRPSCLIGIDLVVKRLKEATKREVALAALRETQWRIEHGHDLTEFATIRLSESWAGLDSGTRFGVMSAGELIEAFPVLGEPVIHGIARRGEVMNFVSDTKCGKTWLVHSTILSLASGRDWLGHKVSRRYRVLLLDNELKPKDIAYRLRVVAEAMGIEDHEWRDRVKVIACRCRGIDVTNLWQIAEEMKGDGAPEVVAVDSLYRFTPAGANENDNSEMKGVMEQLIRFADELDAMTIVVHHSTKGDQSERSVTDVGSGAGSVISPPVGRRVEIRNLMRHRTTQRDNLSQRHVAGRLRKDLDLHFGAQALFAVSSW